VLLLTGFVGTEVLANWAAAVYKLPLGPLLIPGGAFCIPISLLLRDGLHLHHPRTSLGAALLLGAFVSTLLGGQVPRVALASVAAFVVSFAVDTWVFDLCWRRAPEVRMRLSNWASLPVDTFVFVPIAFAGLYPIVPLMLGQLVAKLAMTELAIWVYLLWHRRR